MLHRLQEIQDERNSRIDSALGAAREKEHILPKTNFARRLNK